MKHFLHKKVPVTYGIMMSDLACKGEAIHMGCEMRPWTHFCCTCKKFIVVKGTSPKLIGAGYRRETSGSLQQPTGYKANTDCVCRNDNKKPCQCLNDEEKEQELKKLRKKYPMAFSGLGSIIPVGVPAPRPGGGCCIRSADGMHSLYGPGASACKDGLSGFDGLNWKGFLYYAGVGGITTSGAMVGMQYMQQEKERIEAKERKEKPPEKEGFGGPAAAGFIMGAIIYPIWMFITLD